MHTGYIRACPVGGTLVAGPSAEGLQSPAADPLEEVEQSRGAVQKAVDGPLARHPSQHHDPQARHGPDPAPLVVRRALTRKVALPH